MNFCEAILMLKMEEKKQHFQHIMFYCFKRGENATEMQKKDLCSVWRRYCDWLCQKWFANFCTGDFPLDDAVWSGRPIEVDSDQIETLIEKKSMLYTTQEIVNILKISRWSVENPLHQLGYVNHFDVWVPHKLSVKKPFLTVFPHVILYT